MANNSMLMPLKIERQFSGALDANYEFETLEELKNYASTSPLSYSGQILYCKENDTLYKVNNDKTDVASLGGGGGEDAVIPYIGDNGNWYIDGVDTGVSAKGEKGTDGIDGIDGYSPTVVENANNTEDNYKLDITTKTTSYTTPNLKGKQGVQGIQGEAGEAGKDGEDGTTYTPSIGEVTTVDSTELASASVSIKEETKEAVFNFAIPKGNKGLDGVQISDDETAEDKTWSSKKTSDEIAEKVDKTDITTTINSTSTNAQIPSARAVNELILRGTQINQSVIDKYGTEIIKYPFGRWYIDGNEIAGKFSDIPWRTACIIDITSPITSTRNPWDNTWAYRNYRAQTIENKGTFVRQLESRGTAGVLLDTGWQRVCATSVADVPNTVIVSEDTKVILNSSCYYTVINGVCYVSLWGFQCTEAGQYVVNSSMPKTRLTMKGLCTYGRNGYEGGCAFIFYDANGNNKLYVEAKIANEPLYGSFSYPVAES